METEIKKKLIVTTTYASLMVLEFTENRPAALKTERNKISVIKKEKKMSRMRNIRRNARK